MKFKMFLAAAMLFFMCATAAQAMDLQQARKSGLVGENLNGFVTAISKDAEVASFVAGVNAQRQAAYAKISKENGQPVDIVAKLAAEEIIAKLPAGSKYQNAKGEWVTK
ncbi:MAG: YdbL family protein [Alphaproteobacteria bacterium]|nr:YdbL family protein [Alphaproteobacteria bacterium]MCL2505134.1 YdbL family protein [Alphaproteobacteria bacterium]